MAEVTRRAFFEALASAAAGLGLTYVVGSVPALEVLEAAAPELGCTLDELNELVRLHVAPQVVDDYFKPSPFFLHIKKLHESREVS